MQVNVSTLSVIIGLLGLIGGIVRFEIDSFQKRKERQEDSKNLKDQTELLKEIRDELTPKG